jgi:REP element-mobilizing transposase RayT
MIIHQTKAAVAATPLRLTYMAHTLRAHHFHLIWSTKNRIKCIRPEIQNLLYSYISGILNNHNVKLLEIGGMADHIHLAIEIGLLDNFSGIIRDVKANSSSWLHKKYSDLNTFAWQEGYASYTVSKSGLDKLKLYIRNQVQHHTTLSFEDEYKQLLVHHEVEFDKRFVLG